MTLRTSPLATVHEDRGASFTDFGGWEMPVDFGSIRAEHRAVREAVGKFDVSHMGELAVSGPDAGALLSRVTTRDVRPDALAPGGARYAMVTDEDGVVLDDVMVYRLAGAGGDPDAHPDAGADYLVVPNAGHDAEMAERFRAHGESWGLDARVANVTADRAMVAVQGPDAEDLVAEAAADPTAVRDLDRFAGRFGAVAGVPCWVARTGYTGEDGYELVLDAGAVGRVWAALDCQLAGLGARDTLRIEMGYLLSGQDFHPEENPRTPYEAGVGFAVDLDDGREFVGHDALERVAAEGPAERFVGLRLRERGVPRHGYPILDADGAAVGVVTSGTMSPTLGEPVGLGYVPAAMAEAGTDAQVEIRGAGKRATIESPPFLEGYR